MDIILNNKKKTIKIVNRKDQIKLNQTGKTGPQGPEGPQGPQGKDSTISVGATTTLPEGSQATVINVGTPGEAVLEFGIPKGEKGDKGDQGDPATNLVSSVNGKQGVVVLNSSDVGADALGSAAQALQDAKDYTDTEVSTLDSSLARVAKTGSYNDLSDKPTIPSIAGLATESQVQAVQDNLDAHEADKNNPHSVTKTQVGLGNVDNTSDLDKPISNATQTALDAKATTTALTAHTSNTSNPHSVTKVQVGLGNVDNTSDLNKPVSTATQVELNKLKSYAVAMAVAL